MNKIKYFASTLLLIVTGFMFVTCSDSDSDIEDGGLVNKLKANMWEYKEVGDYNEYEYGGYYGTTTERLYFTDNNIGYCLLIEKDHDSYFGDSKDTTFYKLTYSVSGNTVRWNGYDYKYLGGYLVWNDLIYEPTKMTQSQRDYLNRKIQELNEEEENREISSNIYDYVDATGEYNEENLCIEFTINTELGKKFPGKSFKYGVEYGYGNYNNTGYCEMSGRNSANFYTLVIFDNCAVYMPSYNALREKIDKGQQLTQNEIDLLRAAVNHIEKNVNKFQARIFVEFDGERYYLYSAFYVTIDLDDSYNNSNTGGENNGNSQATGTIQGHEYVDLGLSIKWATCNVGADSPEDYGSCFPWGDTEEYYDYDTYKHWDGYFCDFIGYNISGTKNDVARVKWGRSWRTPTKDEFEELLEKCKISWSNEKQVHVITVSIR